MPLRCWRGCRLYSVHLDERILLENRQRLSKLRQKPPSDILSLQSKKHLIFVAIKLQHRDISDSTITNMLFA
jgi:hypothetical protein